MEAAPNSLLIFDELELHMHRSILSTLWDEIEAMRPDCGFLVITHDLEFAASRVADKFVVRSYNPTDGWDIEDVPDTGFDEQTTTLILGSRRPILFIEGGHSSLDLAIYRACYPTWTVIPRGSCGEVIHAVVTMKANSALTRVTCAGIVDADDHSPVDKALLAASNVSVLPVSEIENLFLLPAVLAAIADQEALDTTAQDSRMNALAEEIVTSTSDKVIKSNVSRYLRRRIDRTLKLMDLSGAQDAQAIALEYSQKTGSLDIADLSTVYEAKLRTALSERDLISIAKLLDDKGLITMCSIRDDHIDPRRSAFFMARSVLEDIRKEKRDARSTA
jgi:hypothetical protein